MKPDQSSHPDEEPILQERKSPRASAFWIQMKANFKLCTYFDMWIEFLFPPITIWIFKKGGEINSTLVNLSFPVKQDLGRGYVLRHMPNFWENWCEMELTELPAHALRSSEEERFEEEHCPRNGSVTEGMKNAAIHNLMGLFYFPQACLNCDLTYKALNLEFLNSLYCWNLAITVNICWWSK